MFVLIFIDLKLVQITKNDLFWVNAPLWYLECDPNCKTWPQLKKITITHIWYSTPISTFNDLSKWHEPDISMYIKIISIICINIGFHLYELALVTKKRWLWSVGNFLTGCILSIASLTCLGFNTLPTRIQAILAWFFCLSGSKIFNQALVLLSVWGFSKYQIYQPRILDNSSCLE
jgi:hypothetical protein